MSTSDDRLTQDLIFDILSSPRRRYMIYYLRTHGGSAEVTELAKHIAAWEYDVDPSELDDQQQKRVYVSLYQTHVPKLDDLGVIDYDTETRIVELTDRAAEIEEYVSPSAATDQPWQWYYLALAGASFVLLGWAGFDVPPMGGVPDIAVGVTVGVALTALALAHYVTWRRDRQNVPDELRARE